MKLYLDRSKTTKTSRLFMITRRFQVLCFHLELHLPFETGNGILDTTAVYGKLDAGAVYEILNTGAVYGILNTGVVYGKLDAGALYGIQDTEAV